MKKIPLRECIGCRQEKPKNELMRIIRTAEGEFVFDDTGKKCGRGAYICKNPDCLTRAIKLKGLDRSFKEKIADEIYDELLSRVKDYE